MKRLVLLLAVGILLLGLPLTTAQEFVHTFEQENISYGVAENGALYAYFDNVWVHVGSYGVAENGTITPHSENTTGGVEGSGDNTVVYGLAIAVGVGAIAAAAKMIKFR